jgi:hypothetical protein
MPSPFETASLAKGPDGAPAAGLQRGAFSSSVTARSANKLQGLVRGVHTAVGAQEFLRKAASTNVALFGRDHERAALSQTEAEKIKVKASKLYNK